MYGPYINDEHHTFIEKQGVEETAEQVDLMPVSDSRGIADQFQAFNLRVII